MDYYLNELDPATFQRLANAVLVARFGHATRLMPLHGPDGGRDAECLIMEAPLSSDASIAKARGEPTSLSAGRYVFQIKHHLVHDGRLTDARKAVVRDFAHEIAANIVPLTTLHKIDHFVLITNVPASAESITGTDNVRSKFLETKDPSHSFLADIWWKEQFCALLDGLPHLWTAFPDMFAGRVVPVMAGVASRSSEMLPRSIRLAIDRQRNRDSSIKFRQISLERALARLFVDLDVYPYVSQDDDTQDGFSDTSDVKELGNTLSSLSLLLNEATPAARYILLQGGPGQGKSTVTQMATQLYRDLLLNAGVNTGSVWPQPRRARLPFRVELRLFADWLQKRTNGSVEEYLAEQLRADSGGGAVSVEDVHTACQRSPVLFVFDGLDEVGSDDLRDSVVREIAAVLCRLESGLGTDVRAILTTRPPAIAGKRKSLPNFTPFNIAPLGLNVVTQFVDRWLSVQESDIDERNRVKTSFERRRIEPHVDALVKNPMQLSVLLHFIRLKGEAFPDRRAELYRDYFQIVIDRDVEKSPSLRAKRDLIESLHEYLGYRIHALTEATLAGGALERQDLLKVVSSWLLDQEHTDEEARSIFQLGQERLGLVVTLRGEGGESHYGFEVQPIREYFAAAYINNQIVGDAHAVFQVLARRPFWREVALFLAGLRRPNEKADLVLRAKQLDCESGLEWRQDGRTLILQLLREGVLTQPRHVFVDALDFVAEILDRAKVPVQAPSEQFARDLPPLMKLVDRDRYRRLCESLLDSVNGSSHVSARWAYDTASGYLDEGTIKQKLEAYRGRVSDVAKLRIGAGKNAGLAMHSLVSEVQFLDGTTPEAAAVEIWNVISGDRTSLAWNFSSAIHQALFYQAAANSRWLLHHGGQEVPRIVPRGLAILQLLRVKMLADEFSAEGGSALQRQEALELDRDVSYDGLDSVAADTVSALIKLFNSFLADGLSGAKATPDVLEARASRLLALVQLAGAPGLLAVRCASSVIRLVSRQKSRHQVMNMTPWAMLVSQCSEAFGFVLETAPDRYWRRECNTLFSRFHAPKRSRTSAGGPYETIGSCIRQAHQGTGSGTLGWLRSIPYALDDFDDLAAAFGDDIDGLAIVLSKSYTYGRIAATERSNAIFDDICQKAEREEDQSVLRMWLYILSLFVRKGKASKELLVKLIRASAPAGTGIRSLFTDSPGVADLEDAVDVLTPLAVDVIDDWRSYSFDNCCAAASYLRRNGPDATEPIIERERELKITHRKES